MQYPSPAEPRFVSHDQCGTLTSAIRTHLGAEPRNWGLARRYEANRFLWIAADPAKRVFLLEVGRVQIFIIDAEGNERILQVVEPGQVFGEVCFCEGRDQPHETNARSVGPIRTREGGFLEFRESLQRNPVLTAHLLETLCVRLCDAEERARILAIRDARVRLVRALQYLATTRGREKPGDPNLVSLTVSHVELASLTAMTRPHTTVIMTRLRKEGVVQYERGSSLTLDLQQANSLLQ